MGKNIPHYSLPSELQPGKKIVVHGITYERFAIKVPRLIEFGENLETVLKEYVAPFYQKGDWVAVSEKIFSISQNLVRHTSTVKVTWLARFIQKGIKKHKNMMAWDVPEKIQIAIEEAGVWRIIPAMVLGVLGKAVGLRGIFWIVAGHRISEIDGVPNDAPPYNEWFVLPPPFPQRDCQELEDKTGIPTVTADANYIDVQVLGVSRGVGLDKKTVRLILLDNPLGQHTSNKMTPFVIVRTLNHEKI